jgi:hypothetical protein
VADALRLRKAKRSQHFFKSVLPRRDDVEIASRNFAEGIQLDRPPPTRIGAEKPRRTISPLARANSRRAASNSGR